MTKIVNITGLAQRLGVTRQTVHNMLKKNKIPIEPIYGLKPLKWRAEDIENWLKPTDDKEV